MEREVKVDTITPQSQVRFGWRAAPLAERDDRRALLFASQILGSRLIKEIREDRGLTYSIACAERRGSFDGMSQLLVQFTADPDKAAEAAKIARAVVEAMRDKAPPTDDEMNAVKRQIQNILDTQLKRPGFWAQTLSTMLTEGRTLAMVKTVESKYASMTKERIAEMLQRYVTDERFYKVIALPGKGD